MDRRLKPYIHKYVKLNFGGLSLNFALSQSLFSSFDVDKGSRLLLKALAQNMDMSSINSVLDMGCGVGVLGICLKKKNPKMDLHMTDRNALALGFTRHNCMLNQIGPVTVEGRLGLCGFQKKRFDLIVSNLPAKAGHPVLKDFFFTYSRHLNESGLLACVIVKILKEPAETSLKNIGAEICFQEATKDHIVILARAGENYISPCLNDCLSAYIRGNYRFISQGVSYSLTTVFNLSDFDTLGYDTLLLMEILHKLPLNRTPRSKVRILFWNPGQGHLPVFISQKEKSSLIKYIFGSRDLLQLEISARNLGHCSPETHHVPALADMKGRFQALVVCPDPDAGVPWPESILTECAALLTERGLLIMAAKSVFVHRIFQINQIFKILENKKNRGFRGLLLQKK